MPHSRGAVFMIHFVHRRRQETFTSEIINASTKVGVEDPSNSLGFR